MNINLPAEFVQSIDSLLKSDAHDFWHALREDPPYSGLRINPRKAGLKVLQGTFPGEFTPLPWEKDGYLIEEPARLGKHSFHAAGLYYLQEPSAMAPVSILDPQPGERVLDLCAAPGGKTTQIASRMGSEGNLVANDPNPHRVQALARNVERWGARNISILEETPQRLAEHFGGYFDRVLVDAPCSGEGTFRAHPGEIKKWSPQLCQRLSANQDEILWYAGKLLRTGGILVYSTCTYNQLENEGTIQRFLEKKPGFDLEDIQPAAGFSRGIPYLGSDPADLTKAIRIWPHISTGEGHFIARLRKTGTSIAPGHSEEYSQESSDTDLLEIYERFFEDHLLLSRTTREIAPGKQGLKVYGDRLYWSPAGSPLLQGLKVNHWGWWLGNFQAGRFIPSPALAAGIEVADCQKVLEFSLGGSDLVSYQRGSPIKVSGDDLSSGTWVLVTAAGFPLGWGKVQKGRLKSYFPKWLRSN